MTRLEFATQIGPTHLAWCYCVTVDGEIWQEDASHVMIPNPWPVATWPWLAAGFGLRWLADSPSVFPAVRIVGEAAVIDILAGNQWAADADVMKVLSRCQQLMKRKPSQYEFGTDVTGYVSASVQAAWESAAPKPFQPRNLPKVPRIGRHG